MSSEVATKNDPIFVEYFDPGYSQAEDLRTIADWIDADPESGYTIHQILLWRGPDNLERRYHHELYYSIDLVAAMGR